MDIKTWIARLESLEATTSQPNPAMAPWLSGLSDADLEKLIGILRRAEVGGEFHDDAEIAWYVAMAASAPAGLFPMTGEHQ